MSTRGGACHFRVGHLNYLMVRHVCSWGRISSHGKSSHSESSHIIQQGGVSDSCGVVSIDDLSILRRKFDYKFDSSIIKCPFIQMHFFTVAYLLYIAGFSC